MISPNSAPAKLTPRKINPTGVELADDELLDKLEIELACDELDSELEIELDIEDETDTELDTDEDTELELELLKLEDTLLDAGLLPPPPPPPQAIRDDVSANAINVFGRFIKHSHRYELLTE